MRSSQRPKQSDSRRASRGKRLVTDTCLSFDTASAPGAAYLSCQTEFITVRRKPKMNWFTLCRGTNNKLLRSADQSIELLEAARTVWSILNRGAVETGAYQPPSESLQLHNVETYVYFLRKDASGNKTKMAESQPSWMWSAPKVDHFQGSIKKCLL